MDSILSRLSWRSKLPVDTGSTNTSDPIKRRSSSVRSRRSISSLFKRQDTSMQEADCQERAHYPMYDPSNPDHHGPPASSVSPDRAEPTTPKKSRLQSITQSLQNTLRAKAAYFYVQRSPERTDASPTSSASKKMVRFREGHSSIDEEPQLAKTWLAEDPQYSPGMLQLNFSQTSLLPMNACPTGWDAQKDASTIPSPRPSPVILPSPLDELPSRPRTISLIDDPFNDIYTTEKDAVKALELPTNQQVVHGQVSASRVSAENHYADSESSCVRPSSSRAESLHSDTDEEPSVLPMSRQAVHGRVNAFRVSSENHDADSESSRVGPPSSRAESSHSDTDEETSVLPVSRQAIHGQVNASRLSSENQDAGSEGSCVKPSLSPSDSLHSDTDGGTSVFLMSRKLVPRQVSTPRLFSEIHDADSESSCVKTSLSRSPSSHSGTDEETSVLTDVRYSTAMPIDDNGPRSAEPEHVECPAASRLADKSNSLPLQGADMKMKDMKIKGSDTYEHAAEPLRQEIGLVTSSCEWNRDAV